MRSMALRRQTIKKAVRELISISKEVAKTEQKLAEGSGVHETARS